MYRFRHISTRKLAGAAFAACVLAPVATAHAAGTQWVTTHTKALHLEGTLIGRMNADRRLSIEVGLPLRNQAAVDRVIESRTVLSAKQARARFSPTTAEARSVAAYLKSEHLTGVSIAPDRFLVSATGSVAEIERAFHTSLSTYRVDGHTVYVNTSAAEVPARLAGRIDSVLGLSDLQLGLSLSTKAVKGRTTSTGSPDLDGFTPQATENAYDATSLPTGNTNKKSRIGIIMSGDPTTTIANLRAAETAFGLPAAPVTPVWVSPEAQDIDDNPYTGNAEWDLDTQISTEMAKDVRNLDLYDIPTIDDSDVTHAINTFVSNDKDIALSASLGECDVIPFTDGAMVTVDGILAEGAAQGQSFFASAGDNGYSCPLADTNGAPGGPPDVSWPSDGEYSTSVGGTTLLADSSGNVIEEIAWIAGGGGVSALEDAPPWTFQASLTAQAAVYEAIGGRTVPDVSAVADENTPVLIYTSTTGDEGVGGTSVSSPLTLGLWDRVQNADGDDLGMAAFDFYSLYNATNPATAESSPLGVTTYIPNSNPQPVTGFRDITLGTNGGCVAKAGYDDCTGIGSVQAAALAGALKK